MSSCEKQLDPIAQFWQQAQALQAHGKTEAALEVYRSILETDARYLPALHQVAHICESRGEFTEAIAAYQKAIEVDKESPFWVYRHLGFALSQKGELEEAIAAYQKALELQPKEARIYHLLGQAQGKLGDIQGEISSYRKAIEIEPEQPSWVYLNLAKALEHQGENEGTLTAYKKALALEPKNAGIEQLLKTAIARNEANEVDRIGRAQQLHQEGKLDAALAEYRSILAEDSTNLTALHKVALICESQEKWEEAIEGYQKAMEVDAEPPSWLYRHLGFSRSQQGNLNGAIEAYERAIALNPEDIDAYSLLGQAQEKVDDLESAILSYRQGLDRQSKEVTFYLLLGNAYFNNQNFKEAVSIYQKIVELFPDNTPYFLYVNLGKILTKKDWLEKIFNIFLDLKSLDIKELKKIDSSALAHYYLAECLFEKYQYDIALKRYRSALQLEPKFSFVYPKIGKILEILDRSNIYLMNDRKKEINYHDFNLESEKTENKFATNKNNRKYFENLCSLKGALVKIDDRIQGWALDEENLERIIELEIYIDDVFIDKVCANEFSLNTWKLHKISSNKAFKFKIPKQYQDGCLHEISIIFSGTNTQIKNSPKLVKLNSESQRAFDRKKFIKIGSGLDFTVRLSHDLSKAIDSVKNVRKLAICAMYQPHAFLEEYHKYLFQEIRKLGYFVIIVNPVLYNSDSLMANSREHCDFAISRENVGYDFGSWLTALRLFKDSLSYLDSVLLFNDSNYGPLFDLNKVHEKMNSSLADFWGITDSWENIYHIQSYFLELRKTAIHSVGFSSFYKQYKFPKEKGEVIQTGEISLTQLLLKYGNISKVYCPYEQVVSSWVDSFQDLILELENLPEYETGLYRTIDNAILPKRTLVDNAKEYYLNVLSSVRKGIPVNISHFMWDTLITKFSCPFIKKELVNFNPMEIPNAYKFFPILSGLTNYDINLITKHKMKIKSCIPPFFVQEKM